MVDGGSSKVVGGSLGGGCVGASAAGAELHSQPMTVPGVIELTVVRDTVGTCVTRIAFEFRWQGTNDGGVVS